MVEDLSFDGKSFIAIQEASKETGYSRDYLGQLIRAKKLDARMIGRVWYVSRGSLSGYESERTQKQKYKANTEDLVQPSTGKFENFAPLTLIPDSYVPKNGFSKPIKILKKGKEIKFAKNKKELGVNFPVTFGVTFVLVCSLVYVSGLSSGVIKAENPASVSSAAGNIIASLTSFFRKSPAPRTGKAVIVLPNSADHDQEVQAVKNAFSDEVDVTLDKSGSSGIVRPVFRSGQSDDSYTFVLVPLQSQ